MRRTTVLLAEDHAIVREGLRVLLELDPDIEIIGVAQDGRSAVELARRLRPDVVVMDIAMPLLNGIEATRQVLHPLPTTKILMLSAHRDEAYIAKSKEVGAVGYLLKQSSPLEVSQAVLAVGKGSRFFSYLHRGGALRPDSSDSNRLASHAAAHRAPRQTRPNGLTPREMEVLQLIAEGKANKETAAVLGISIKTVEKHREHLMSRLGIHDTAGLTRYAIAAGIIDGGVRLTIV